jgi:hypothetical protein
MSRKLKNNISRTEKLTVHTDKGNAMVVLNTSEYMEKVLALLDDPANKKSAKNPTQSTEWKTTLFIKASPLPEDVTKQL